MATSDSDKTSALINILAAGASGLPCMKCTKRDIGKAQQVKKECCHSVAFDSGC